MAKDYFKSKEFQEILHSYEQWKDRGKSIYLDAEDFADVADFYLGEDLPAYAMEAAETGLAIHPDDDILMIMKSAICIYMHRYDDAESILEELDHENSDVKYQLAQLQYARYHNVDEAERIWREWIAQYSDEISPSEEEKRENYIHIVSSFIELAEYDDNKGYRNWDESVVRKWIREYIDIFQPLGRYESDVQLIDICRENELADLLCEVLSQVLEEQPYLNKGWSCLALSYYTMQQYEQALEAADFALAINVDDLDALLAKAHSVNEMGDRSQAKSIFKEYLDKGGQIVQIIPYAELLFLDGEKDEALYQLEWLSAHFESKRAEIEHEMNKIAWSGYRGKRRQKTSYDDDFFDLYQDVYSDIGDMFYRYEYFEDSISAYKRILEVNPKCSEAYFMLGMNNLTLYRYSEAFSKFRLALKWAEDQVMTGVDIALTFVLNDFESYALEVINAVDEIAVYSNSDFVRNIPAVKSLIYLKLGNTVMFLHFFKIACQKTPDLIKKVYEGYFPSHIPVNQWYDCAETEINSLLKNLSKENSYIARF